MAEKYLTLESVVAALLRARLATLTDVWDLGFADVRRAGRLMSSQKLAAPTHSDLQALMRSYPDTDKDPNNG